MRPSTVRVWVATVSVMLAATAAFPAAFGQTTIRVIVDGSAVLLNPSPLVREGRVFVPLRGVFERMGALVEWKPVTRTVVIVRQRISVELRLNTRTMSVNGSPVPMDVPPPIVGGRVFIPLRLMSEAIGGHVQWQAGFTAGTYRLKFSYALVRGFLNVEPVVVFSDQFRIN